MHHSNYVYKFYGRIGADREQFIKVPDAPESMFLELADLQRDFGDKWIIWIERFHRVHPHTQFQRRVEGFLKPKNLPLKLSKNEGRVEGWIDPSLETP